MISIRRVCAALFIVTVAAAGGAACGGDEATGPGNGVPDSATPVPDTSTTNADSSTIPDTSVVVTPIPCGMTTCDPTSQVCCATLQSQTCVAMGAPCMGAVLACTSEMNCTSGDVCCLERMGMSFNTTCKPMCAGGFTEPQLCASDTECTPPDKCQTLFGTYKVCAPPYDGGFMFDGGFPKDAGGPG